jgi:basic membrane lipoprotein Med (substrate-binding protein (PBP1-ABC) superfamily)
MIINVFDCETYKNDNNDVVIYCISYMINNEIKSIYKDDKNDIFIVFLDDVISKSNKKKTFFYIHNINFDGILILESIFKNNLKFE